MFLTDGKSKARYYGGKYPCGISLRQGVNTRGLFIIVEGYSI